MKLRYALAFVLSLLTFSACNDEEDEGTLQTIDATITWTGNPAVDGCGFVISTQNDTYPRYKPVNESAIPESYKTGESFEVELQLINYNETVVACMWGRQYTKIKILNISPR
jgi:hypothetical protein